MRSAEVGHLIPCTNKKAANKESAEGTLLAKARERSDFDPNSEASKLDCMGFLIFLPELLNY